MIFEKNNVYNFIYNGGSHPGTRRTVLVTSVNGNNLIETVDLESEDVRRFTISKTQDIKKVPCCLYHNVGSNQVSDMIKVFNGMYKDGCKNNVSYIQGQELVVQWFSEKQITISDLPTRSVFKVVGNSVFFLYQQKIGGTASCLNLINGYVYNIPMTSRVEKYISPSELQTYFDTLKAR